MEVNRMEGGGYRFASPEAAAQPVKDGVSAVREPAESVRGRRRHLPKPARRSRTRFRWVSGGAKLEDWLLDRA